MEARIDDLLSWVSKQTVADVCVTVKLSFYETRVKSSWLGSAEERVHWEQWRIQLQVCTRPDAPHANRRARHEALEAALSRSLLFILRRVNDKLEHIPPVSAASSGPMSHPFEIGGWAADKGDTLESLKRLMIHSRPPMNVL